MAFNAPDSVPPGMTCTTVLLAGGKSRRMGREKAELWVRGETLWERQVATLRALGGEMLLSGRANGPWADAQIEVVEDRWPDCGPLGGLATVLERASAPWVAVLAIDLPLVTSELLGRLLQQAVERRKGAIPWDGEKFHPLSAVYPKSAATLAQARLLRGALALQGLVRELEEGGAIQRYVLADSERPLLANVNTPEDWQRVAAEW
jgi:molybdopterin-guanine dinucleotide biosynthesis protein A